MGHALRDGQPLPLPALSSNRVSMRLKAEIAQQRAASEGTAEQVRPPVYGNYAVQVCLRAIRCVWIPTSSGFTSVDRSSAIMKVAIVAKAQHICCAASYVVLCHVLLDCRTSLSDELMVHSVL